MPQNFSPVDCSSHFPRTRKRTCALGLLSGTLQPMKAVPPSSATMTGFTEVSKLARPKRELVKG